MTKKKTKSFGAPLKAPANQIVLAALADAQSLARIIREALPVKGLEGSYSDESPAVRQRAEDEAAWHLIRLSRVTSPGAFAAAGPIVLPWDSLGRVVAEIREFWGWADQDGESRIPSSRAREGRKLKPLPPGLLKRLETACRLLEAGARALPDDSKDPDLEQLAEAVRLWQTGKYTWPEIAERVGKLRIDWKSFSQAVKRYAEKREIKLRKANKGRRGRKEID